MALSWVADSDPEEAEAPAVPAEAVPPAVAELPPDDEQADRASPSAVTAAPAMTTGRRPRLGARRGAARRLSPLGELIMWMLSSRESLPGSALLRGETGGCWG
jgi:hypothetical protein